MDKTEVTFAAYQQCVKEKKCRASRPFYSDFDRPNQPMMGMTWYDANTFCKAQGKRLCGKSQRQARNTCFDASQPAAPCGRHWSVPAPCTCVAVCANVREFVCVCVDDRKAVLGLWFTFASAFTFTTGRSVLSLTHQRAPTLMV